MATETELMAMGIPWGPARALGSNINTSVVAAGASQATATVLAADYNILTTAAAAGVQLPSPVGMSDVIIMNVSGNTQNVYPPVGLILYQGSNVAVNTAYALANNKMLACFPVGNAWFGILSGI